MKLKKYKTSILFALILCVTFSSNAQERTKYQKLDESYSLYFEIDVHQNQKQELNLSKNYSTKQSRNNQVIDSDLSEQLQAVLDEAIINYDIKGLSAAIQNVSGDTWAGSSGVSHDTVSIKNDMLFGIGSITKNFIATIILQLYEEGSLTLNDSLYQWLPLFQYIDSTATINQLLNHTSGFYNYLMYPGIDDTIFAHQSKIWTPEEILEKFVLEAYFDPGTNWAYSNTNYILLGLIIEKVTGNSLLYELHNRLTIPLSLNSTFLYPDEDYIGIRSHCWMPWGNDIIDLTVFEDSSWYSVYWAAGAIMSTSEQLVNWQKGLYEGSLLNDTTLELMKQPAPYSDGIYGLGTLIASLNGEWVYGHDGDVVYYSLVLYVPGDSLSIAVISNTRFVPVNSIWLDLYTTYKMVTGVESKIFEESEIKVYPSPFSTSTTIEYYLTQPETVTTTFYNQFGKLVDVIVESHSTGINRIIWTPENLADGIYYFRLQGRKQLASGKVVLVR